MPVLPLRLRITAPPLPVAAGWLPVGEVALWLAEAWRVVSVKPEAVVKFYPLAKSVQDQRVAGVIITVSRGEPYLKTPPSPDSGMDLDRVFGPRVQRLGEALPGVLVPVNTRIEPALTETERRRFFAWPLHFIHPVMGLTGFEERDALLPWQLLAAPVTEKSGWFAAVPGPPAPPPLRQLTLVQELSLEEMLAGEADGIGLDSPDNSTKAGAGPLGKAGAFAVGALGALGAGVLSGLGGGLAAEKLTQWSRRQMQDLKDRRSRELNKLLDQFEKNPLDALRHAIPLTGAESRRGNAAEPGWKLGARNPDLTTFSHGGGVVDVWSISSDTRLKLERKYRDAAAKEAAAGHFGRAAYIYGELLGDWARAAEMLEKAGRPREAARIYMERLRSGTRAAQCLEKAGLLAEAAALYREAHQYEKAGDLLAALGQTEEARSLWETALKNLSNPLDQARLLETKLNDPGRALLTLQRAWPGGGQAQACFEAHFALLGRLGRHEASAAILDKVEHDPKFRFHPPSAMVSGLYHVFSKYPDFALRAKAAELATPLIGEALSDDPARTESAKLLALLPKFSPEDVLLARDAGRFSLTKHRPAVPLLERSQSTVLKPNRVIQLDAAVTWDSLTDSPGGPHVVGWSRGWEAEKHYVSPIAGTCVNGCLPQRQTWPGYASGTTGFRHLVRSAIQPFVIYHSDSAQHADWCVSGRKQVQRSSLALGPGRNGEFLLLVITETGTLAVEYYGGSGELRETRVLDYAPLGMEKATWFTGAHGNELWIAGMEAACCVTEKNEFQQTTLNGPLTGFAVAPPVLPNQAMAAGGHEVVLLIPKASGKQLRENGPPAKPLECVNLFSGNESLPPVCAFTNDGRAIIADAAGGVVYQLRGEIRKLADIVIPADSGGLTAATAIGPTGFAFLTKSGKVLGFGF
ncbi:MAG: hypothetical protein V4726_23085 [Verrucomicrobiota bacterium]